MSLLSISAQEVRVLVHRVLGVRVEDLPVTTGLSSYEARVSSRLLEKIGLVSDDVDLYAIWGDLPRYVAEVLPVVRFGLIEWETATLRGGDRLSRRALDSCAAHVVYLALRCGLTCEGLLDKMSALWTREILRDSYLPDC